MSRVRGFTLVEILVALTLFAVVGGSLLQLFQSGLRNARLASDQAHAVLLARSKLTELQAYDHLSPGTFTGSIDDTYHWQAELRLQDDADTERKGLQPLDVGLSISWGEPGDERSFALHSLLLTRWVQP